MVGPSEILICKILWYICITKTLSDYLPHISLASWIFASSSIFCCRSFSANCSSSVSGDLSASCCSFKASRSAILSASFFLGLVLVVFVSSLVESLLLSSSESLLSQASLMSSPSSSPSHLSVGSTLLGSNPSASRYKWRWIPRYTI